MPILNNCELSWVFVNPENPRSNRFDSSKPKQWEVCISTKDKKQRDEWKAAGLKVKAIRKDKDDEDSEIMFYSVNLHKSSVTKAGKVRPPVTLVDRKGKPYRGDPSQIGNGSIANVMFSPYEFTLKDGTKKIANELTGLQLLKVSIYEAQPQEEFASLEGETVFSDNGKNTSGFDDMGDDLDSPF